MTRPLGSRLITSPSMLLRVVPPLCPASVLRFLRSPRLDFSLNIGTTLFKGSMFKPVPCSRRLQAGCHVGCLQVLADIAPGTASMPRFRHRLRVFSTLHQRFPCVRLHGSHLTWSHHAFYARRSPPRLLTVAARVDLPPDPVVRRQEAYSYLEHSFSFHTDTILISLPSSRRLPPHPA